MATLDPVGDRRPHLLIKTEADVDHYLALLRVSAGHAIEWLCAQPDDRLQLLYRMKFELVGRHPVEDRPLNLIEQINQTCTFAVALVAAKELLRRHSEANGFKVAPGADMALPLDIMSVEENLVGAETFAAVDPRNNRKLARDLAKMAARPETYRYVIFSSPRYPGLKHRREFDSAGVQVWSVDI